jgi:hypothetical protein
MTIRFPVGELLKDASAEEAQLVLSYLVWPRDAPDPRVVDKWLRRRSWQDPVSQR